MNGALRMLGVAVWLSVAAVAAPAQPSLRLVTETFVPYTYAVDGRAAGPMVDVLQAACARLEWRCEVEVLPWRRALNAAQRGDVDGIFTVTDSPERRQYFHLSPPIIDSRYVLFARQGSSFQYAGEPQSLAGRVIGAYGPSGTALALEQLIHAVPQARSEIEPDNRTALRKLAGGRYGADGLVLANESVAQHLLREDGIRNVQPAGFVRSFGYAFGLSRQGVTLDRARLFAKTLTELCRSGRTAELLKPYGLPPSACVKP
jgi:polar amino acid transport system substrate-binding protein